MTRKPVPPALNEVLETLAAHPEEAARKFVALSRWKGKKRSVLAPDRIGQELGKAYREEVARILGQQLYVLLFEDPLCGDLLHASVRLGERLVLPATEDLRGHASRALMASGELPGDLEPSIAQLEAVRDGEPFQDRLDSFLVAWRLCPLDNLAFVGTFEYFLRREWKASMRFLEPLLTRPLTKLHLSCAYEAYGSQLLAQGALPQASEAYEQSSNCGEDRPIPLCFWFIVSLVLGDIQGVEESGRRIEEMLDPAAPESTTSVRAWNAAKGMNDFDARIHPALKRRQTVFGEHTGRIHDALR